MGLETQFLERGLRLVENGFRIIPVKAGQKRPGVDEWQMVNATPALVRKWAQQGFADGNIGIITANNPAIDLDIYDAEMAEKMEAWCLSEFGDTAVRIGRAPKRLLVYSSVEPFTKMFATYQDSRGTKHKIEVLGDGQQFVAYGIHPDTKQPFRWTSLDEPLDTPADMLPTLTREMAVRMLEQYGKFAEAAGWKLIGSSTGSSRTLTQGDDDALATLKPRLQITMPEVLDALNYVDGADEYDRWLMVGMALHHQARGSRGGLDVWHQWSEQAHNYSASVLDEKWESFKDITSRSTVTFASVLKIANENKKREQTAEFERALNTLRTATSEEDVFGPIAKQLVAAISTDFQVDIVAKKMQERVQELTGVKPQIATVRKTLSKAKRKADGDRGEKETPAWCDGWVYLKNGDLFFHVESKSELTERGFNAVYDREVLSEEDRLLGVAIPGARAAALALNVYGIPTVDNTVYLPGFDKIVEVNGKTCVNTFNETSVPKAKAPETADEFAAIERVERHFAVLLPNESERAMVLDYFSYNVQFPAEKIVWALLMVGAEGGGKTILKNLMARVLGPQNVSPVSASVLQDKFTGWAEGRKMVFVEEIRLHGANRFEILDKMKPYVSNEEVDIRKQHRDGYEIPNVTNYVLYTNHWDGMPFSKMDRRYYVVGTYFQTKEQLDEWGLLHPSYFADLYDDISQRGDVLRWWLLNRQLSPAFQPKRPAVETWAKKLMRDQSDSSDESDVLEDVLEASTDPEISSKLLNSAKLRDVMENEGRSPPYGRAFNSMISKAGFVFLGRFRVGGAGAPNVRYYTRMPQLFPQNHEVEAIREIIGHVDDVDPFA